MDPILILNLETVDLAENPKAIVILELEITLSFFLSLEDPFKGFWVMLTSFWCFRKIKKIIFRAI